LRQGVPKDFSQEYDFLQNFVKVPKNSVFCKKTFPFCQTQDFCTLLKSAQSSASLDTHTPNFEEIFFQLLQYKGQHYFFRRIEGQIR
jgi:hypothetical protein